MKITQSSTRASHSPSLSAHFARDSSRCIDQAALNPEVRPVHDAQRSPRTRSELASTGISRDLKGSPAHEWIGKFAGRKERPVFPNRLVAIAPRAGGKNRRTSEEPAGLSGRLGFIATSSTFGPASPTACMCVRQGWGGGGCNAIRVMHYTRARGRDTITLVVCTRVVCMPAIGVTSFPALPCPARAKLAGMR